MGDGQQPKAHPADQQLTAGEQLTLDLAAEDSAALRVTLVLLGDDVTGLDSDVADEAGITGPIDARAFSHIRSTPTSAGQRPGPLRGLRNRRQAD